MLIGLHEGRCGHYPLFGNEVVAPTAVSVTVCLAQGRSFIRNGIPDIKENRCGHESRYSHQDHYHYLHCPCHHEFLPVGPRATPRWGRPRGRSTPSASAARPAPPRARPPPRHPGRVPRPTDRPPARSAPTAAASRGSAGRPSVPQCSGALVRMADGQRRLDEYSDPRRERRPSVSRSGPRRAGLRSAVPAKMRGAPVRVTRMGRSAAEDGEAVDAGRSGGYAPRWRRAGDGAAATPGARSSPPGPRKAGG